MDTIWKKNIDNKTVIHCDVCGVLYEDETDKPYWEVNEIVHNHIRENIGHTVTVDKVLSTGYIFEPSEDSE